MYVQYIGLKTYDCWGSWITDQTLCKRSLGCLWTVVVKAFKFWKVSILPNVETQREILTLFLLTAESEDRQANSAAVNNVCDRSIACSVFEKAFATLRQSISIGNPKKTQVDSTDTTEHHVNCATLDASYSRHSYDNGRFTVNYAIKGECDCKASRSGKRRNPICSNALSLSNSACNLAQFCHLISLNSHFNPSKL
ncbi:hypothetical protein BY996DRAFT_8688985 [Phakopsora pachyrhizi]|nr:hypothetical protein BY996DRAFT_8688985 [Phakopsora pachyrhizi]